jgi:hypothetical protein
MEVGGTYVNQPSERRSATGRRAYDTVTAEIALAIEDGLRDTRHALRDEITAFRAHVEAGNLQATREHAEVKASIDELRRDVLELKLLEPRVTTLEGSDKADHAVIVALEKNRESLRHWALGLAGLIVAAAGVLAAVLSQTH